MIFSKFLMYLIIFNKKYQKQLKIQWNQKVINININIFLTINFKKINENIESSAPPLPF